MLLGRFPKYTFIRTRRAQDEPPLTQKWAQVTCVPQASNMCTTQALGGARARSRAPKTSACTFLPWPSSLVSLYRPRRARCWRLSRRSPPCSASPARVHSARHRASAQPRRLHFIKSLGELELGVGLSYTLGGRLHVHSARRAASSPLRAHLASGPRILAPRGGLI